MSYSITNAVNDLLPYVKKILLQNELEIESNINQWLQTKGFFIRFVGTKFIPVVWDLVMGPLLPLILKTAVTIVCGLTCPYLSPLIPVIDKAIDMINDKYLSVEEKAKLLDMLKLLGNKQNVTTQLAQVVLMSDAEKKRISEDQEYFPDFQL